MYLRRGTRSRPAVGIQEPLSLPIRLSVRPVPSRRRLHQSSGAHNGSSPQQLNRASWREAKASACVSSAPKHDLMVSGRPASSFDGPRPVMGIRADATACSGRRLAQFKGRRHSRLAPPLLEMAKLNVNSVMPLTTPSVYKDTLGCAPCDPRVPNTGQLPVADVNQLDFLEKPDSPGHLMSHKGAVDTAFRLLGSRSGQNILGFVLPTPSMSLEGACCWDAFAAAV